MIKVLGLLLTVGLLALGHPWGQSVPPSPCPDIFRYKVDSAGMSYALISVPCPEPYFNIILEVFLAINGILPLNYVGDLHTVEDNTQIWRRLVIGDKQPILYKFNFPYTIPLPKLERITVNQNVICQGKPPSNMLTKFSVAHTLSPISKSQLDQNLTSLQTNTTLHSSGHECGVSFTTRVKRVTNGMATERGQWPWLIAMYKRSAPAGLKFQCGGTVLSKTVVLTAAHCIKINGWKEVKAEAIVLLMGKHNLEEWGEQNNQVRYVKRVHFHPDYIGDSKMEADLAILVLKEQVEYTKYVQPICLWPFSSDLNLIVGQTATVVGWGRYESGDLSSIPRMATMPIVTQGECLFSNKDFVSYSSNRTFCAGSRDGSGPCTGDSGGALMLNYQNDQPRWYLRGIVHLSFDDKQNQRCDLTNYLIYTDVAKFMSWIQQFVPH